MAVGRQLILRFEAIVTAVLEGRRHSFHDVPSATTQGFVEHMLGFFTVIPTAIRNHISGEAALVKGTLLQLHRGEDENRMASLEMQSECDTLHKGLWEKLARLAGPEEEAKFRAEYPELLVARGTRFDALQLTHELIMDPAFKIELAAPSPYAIYQAHDEILPEPDYEAMVEELRSGAHAVCVDAIKYLAGFLHELGAAWAVDIEYIEDQLQRGTYGLDEAANMLSNVAEHLLRIVPEEEWPGHLGRMDEGETPENVVDAFRFVVRHTHLCRQHTANSRLAKLVAVIQSHGADYERDKFKHNVLHGRVVTQNCERWAQIGVAACGIPLPQLALGGDSDVRAAHAWILVSILLEPGPLVPTDLPETLYFDTHRILTARDELRGDMQAAALMTSLPGLQAVWEAAVRRERPAMDPEEELLPLVPPGLRARARLALEPGNAIYGVVRTRFVGLLVGFILTGSFPPVVTTPAITALRPRFDATAHTLRRVAEVHRAAHCEFYNSLILTAARV